MGKLEYASYPTTTHLGLDQDFVTGDLKGSSSMTVLFLRSSGDGFAGIKVFIQIITNMRGDNLLKFTRCFPFRTLVLLADDKSKISAAFMLKPGRKGQLLPLTHSSELDGWPQKGNVSHKGVLMPQHSWKTPVLINFWLEHLPKDIRKGNLQSNLKAFLIMGGLLSGRKECCAAVPALI